MCGRNTDCSCSTEKQKEHEAAERKVITAALIAAADERLSDEEYSPPERFECVITVEGVRTSDHRRIEANGLIWRNLPWNLMAQFQNDGHRGAQIVGNIETITREPWAAVEGANLIKGAGTFDLTSEFGRRAATMVDNQTLRFGSVDLEGFASEFIILDEKGEVNEDGNIWEIIFGGGDEEFDFYENFTHARAMGHTLVPMPAFQQAVIVPEGQKMDIPKPFKSNHLKAKPLIASGVTIPTTPPAQFFDDPELAGPTPLTIDNDGRIYGHVALWETCHIGVQDVCITPPRSNTDYAHFKQGGGTETAEGTIVKTGKITYDTGHASTTAGWKDTVAHYDNTGTVAADIAVGEDEHGIWFSGALRNNLTADDIRTVRAAPLSGDWRDIDGDMELVGALAVNIPGFPIVASAGMEMGKQVSLRAAAVPQLNPMEDLTRQVQRLTAMVEGFVKPPIVASLKERVMGPEREKRAAKIADLQSQVNGDEFKTSKKKVTSTLKSSTQATA